MNLFSQSKLTLKLKKSTSSLSADTTDKFQKPTIKDSIKSEYLPNNSVVSESESFVEVLNAAQSLDQKPSMSQNVFKSFSSEESVSNIIYENKPCPVCSQMVDVKHFINHVKSCGTAHNLSSEILIKAVDLQERQAAERDALGLPKITKNKDVNKKRNTNINKHSKLKIGIDSNLDLAIAMSVSLQESKEAEIIKESETLLEAGLENEAIQKRKTLESFGFLSNQPVKCKPKASRTNSILFKQSKEDREKRITEKVAMILIDSDTDAPTLEVPVDCPCTIIGSKYLNKIRNIDNKLWKKSLLNEESVNEFYVNNLSKFIKPSEINNYSSFTKDFQFPVLTNTPIQDPRTNSEECLSALNTEVENSNCIQTPITSHNIVENKTIFEYSTKWKSMVDNQFMSDITIFAKDEREIFAHTLVLYVQCPDILDDIITEESDTCKSKKMVMWSEYSYEACLAFLKFIYSGQKSFIETEFREDYLSLGTRYNILVDINDDENQGWVLKELDNVSKRKSTELDNSPTRCKRFKASSPDMFTADEMSPNFLGAAVNDEKSLSILRTKQWLHSCNSSQKYHHSSFTGNQINNSSLTILPDKSPSHSFHSASTISLPLSYISNHMDYNMDSKNHDLHINSSPNVNRFSPKSLSIGETSLKSISIIEHKIQSTPKAPSTLLPNMSTLTNLHREPELITIDSDSESESIDIILSSNIKKSFNNNTALKKNRPLISSNSGNNISIIELNDNSSDSIHLASTSISCQKNHTPKLNHSLVHNLSITPKNRTFLNDELSVFSAITNVLSTNNLNTQELPLNDHKSINLVEDNSFDSVSTIKLTGPTKNDDSLKSVQIYPWNNDKHMSQNYSTSFSNVLSPIGSISKCETMNSILNLSPKKNEQLLNFPFLNGKSNYSKKTNENSDLNSINSSVKRNLFECDSKSSISNDSNNENNVINKPISNLTLEDITKVKLPSNNYDDLLTNMNKVEDLASGSSNIFINEQNTFKPINIQVESEINNTPDITIPNENIYEQNKSDFEQIIDDPWIDYNDWQPDNMSSHNVSPILLESNSTVLVDTSEVMTPNKDGCNIDLVQTPTITNNSYRMNSQKKSAVTPNKYGSRLNTPKSLRRVQSESIIGSKEKVTPLPDYSIMETPDLRKEFDRYGLKDLGRRKGKLILRHIYDVLHPSQISEEAKRNIELEQYSDSSDSSERGIPDYECEHINEIETFSQANSINKTSIEIGFKQLIELNEDLHKKILCYEPIWIEDLKEDLKQYNVNISMQKLITFLDDKCVTFRSKSLIDQRQKTLTKKNTKRKKLF